MTAPILLVHDDIAAIATLRRLLSRQGHEVVLATTVADAITTFSHHRPKLILVSPAVEDNRGEALLEELAATPDGPSTPMLLLGDALPNVDVMVVPLPVQADSLREKVEEAMAHEPVWAFSGSVPLDLPPDLSTDETTLPDSSSVEFGMPEETPVGFEGIVATSEEVPLVGDEDSKDTEEKARALELEEGEARARAARLARSAGVAKEAVSRAVRLAQMLQKKQEEERAIAEQTPEESFILEEEPVPVEPAPSVVADPEPVIETPEPVIAAPEPVMIQADESTSIQSEPVIGVISAPQSASIATESEIPSADLKEFDLFYERLLEVDYFDALGVPRSASAEDVRNAFETLSKAYHPLRYVAHPDAAIRRRVEQIHELLTEAFWALSDEALKSAYSSHLPP